MGQQEARRMNDASWSTALWQPDAPTPAGWGAHNGSSAKTRFDVYRNNVQVSLWNALADTFPAVRAEVGDAVFATLAHTHMRDTPPQSPVMALFGARFADFLRAHPVALTWPYLPDLARLEFARVACFHAADAPALSAESLHAALQEPGLLPQLRWQLAPCVHVIQSPWPIVQRWRQACEDAAPSAPPTAPAAESALVCREAWDVVVIPLTAAEAAFVTALQDHAPLGEAVGQALQHSDTFDLSQTLAMLLRQACLTPLTPQEQTA